MYIISKKDLHPLINCPGIKDGNIVEEKSTGLYLFTGIYRGDKYSELLKLDKAKKIMAFKSKKSKQQAEAEAKQEKKDEAARIKAEAEAKQLEDERLEDERLEDEKNKTAESQT